MAENGSVQSVERVFSVIEAMCKEKESSVTGLAKATGLNKTTVYRFLNTLLGLGYVIKNEENEMYSLTLKFLRISSKRLSMYDIQHSMKPQLEKLSKECGETVHLVERNGARVVYIDKFESDTNSVRMVSRIGMSLNIFTTAVGKAMLSNLEDGEIKDLWQCHTHNKKTEYTITALEDFLCEIEEIRKCGYAIDNEENELGVRCVAVAIPDAYGQYRYAVSVSAPKDRMDDRKVSEQPKDCYRSVRNSLILQKVF